MAEILTLLQLNQAADLRDKPFLDQITNDLVNDINSTTLAEVDYTVTYNVQAIIGTLLPLQQQRILLKIHTLLISKSYTTYIDENSMLVVKWVIATLFKS